MKTCEAEGIIYGIIGHNVNWGPVKLFPVLGSEVPVEEQGHKTQIGLTRDWYGENGTFAEMVNPQTVDIFNFSGVIKIGPPIRRLVGPQINRSRLTRGHLRWVKEKVPNSYIEAAQRPDSTL